MARPIELGWKLEGEAAREFWENEKKPATSEQMKLAKNAKKMFKRIRFDS
jgi:hypothetical protein